MKTTICRSIIVLRTAGMVKAYMFLSMTIHAQCKQEYDWVTWSPTTEQRSMKGAISAADGEVAVTLSANYDLQSTTSIWRYHEDLFQGLREKGIMPPQAQVPATTWSGSNGVMGRTSLCFSHPLDDPILFLASIGDWNIPVTLNFSVPYEIIFDVSGMSYPSDTIVVCAEGNAILRFPGAQKCITVDSSTPEFYSNFTWGIVRPAFALSVKEETVECGRTTLVATGGVSYAWNAGMTPEMAVNAFSTSGEYRLTVTDANGCSVVRSGAVQVKADGSTTSTHVVSTFGPYEWSGQVYDASGVYTFKTLNAAGCDSIATLQLTVQKSQVDLVSSDTRTSGPMHEFTAAPPTAYLPDGYYKREDLREKSPRIIIDWVYLFKQDASHPVEMKRVTHWYGGTYYFQDGISITAERFGYMTGFY